jgi:hypothetical protein
MWLIQSVTLTMTFLLSIIAHLVPALFQVFVWLTRFAFALLFRVTGWSIALGGMVILSGVTYAVIALLMVPLVQIVIPAGMAFVLLGTSGGVWGLCVGHQAGLLWQAEQLRRPDTNTQRLFGLPTSFFHSAPQSRGEQSAENVVHDGIILGQTGEWDDRG